MKLTKEQLKQIIKEELEKLTTQDTSEEQNTEEETSK
jgi:hypothetical protein|tara:strand:+ start:1028 stop:1138 length:111 start_codon:yes stop_codon:yes gene_type:complete